MIKLGTWFHADDGMPLDAQVASAAAHGITSARSYDASYSERAAPALKAAGMGLFAGLWIAQDGLLEDWRSQLHYDELERLYALDVRLDAICVGNELREGGDDPQHKRFTPRLAEGLVKLLAAYRDWQARQGVAGPLTYALEAIAFDADGTFPGWIGPLLEACDVVSVNLYPMDDRAWFGTGAFEASRELLTNPEIRHERLALFERRLRRMLEQLASIGKPLVLSEVGIPSAIGGQIDQNGNLTYEPDRERFGQALAELFGLIGRANADYGQRIAQVYVYEWRDNPRHQKITNVEQSPIHATFGLCDQSGTPKFDLRALVAKTE